MFDISIYQKKIKKYTRRYLLEKTSLSAYTVRLILAGKDDTVKLKVIKILDKFFAQEEG